MKLHELLKALHYSDGPDKLAYRPPLDMTCGDNLELTTVNTPERVWLKTRRAILKISAEITYDPQALRDEKAALKCVDEKLAHLIIQHLYEDRYQETARLAHVLMITQPYSCEYNDALNKLVRYSTASVPAETSSLLSQEKRMLRQSQARYCHTCSEQFTYWAYEENGELIPWCGCP